MSLQNPLLFPPDSECLFKLHYNLTDPFLYPNQTCPITSSMIDYLNISSSVPTYFQAYCLNPPSDDACVFGYCPNPDIAGPLVRISAYVTNICLSIVIFYAPKNAETAFWSQVLTVYSLLITSGIAIIQTSLTRLHAILATVTAASPLSMYLVLYSLISMWNKKHRLNGVVGEGHIIPRILMLIAGALWICLFVYIVVPKHIANFSQESCEQHYYIVQKIYTLPFIFVEAFVMISPFLGVVVLSPVVLTAIAWVVAIIRQRKTIWPEGERWRPRFGRVWSITGRQYSFIHFMTIVVIPTLYWVITIETACLFSSDEYFSLSFGQVLASFVALPPLVSVLQLTPQLCRWFMRLLWVRRLLGRKTRKTQNMMSSIPLTLPSSSTYEEFDSKSDTYSLDEKEKPYDASPDKPDAALYTKLEG